MKDGVPIGSARRLYYLNIMVTAVKMIKKPKLNAVNSLT
jgi:hypothetical protein